MGWILVLTGLTILNGFIYHFTKEPINLFACGFVCCGAIYKVIELFFM